MQKRAALVTSLIAATMIVPVSAATAAVDDVNTTRLTKAVTVNGILKHERALQRIANANGGNRAAGTPGYAASVDYVKGQLVRAGYDVKVQKFEFPSFVEVGPATLSQVSPTPTDYTAATLEYSGNGQVTGRIVPTNDVQIPPPATPGSTSGCEASDFAPASTTEPEIALIQRGTCTFAIKVANAEAAGYDGVVVFNEGQPGRTDVLENVTLGSDPEVDIPVVGVSFADGAALYAAAMTGPVTVDLKTDTRIDTVKTSNVLADSRAGNPDKVVVVGAHLDSVAAGPGINDNGSGTATILETAVQMSRLGIQPRQKLRFAFWGGEEAGLQGSTHYVTSLGNRQLGTIYANLNFDMLGSPNYVRFVYDGDGSGDSGTPDSEAGGPPGSAQIEDIFNNYFADHGLETEPTDFDGRSDYGPFIAAGIPAGGLFSGAEGIKTEAEAVIYGGTAGIAYDRCYHQACDTINNLSTKALAELGDAAAHAVMTLARTKSGLFEDGSRMANRTAAAPQQRTLDYSGNSLQR